MGPFTKDLCTAVAVAAVVLFVAPGGWYRSLLLLPLWGALVRFRVNYNPKSLQLDTEAAVQTRTGPVVTSYFAMVRRVYQLEGFSGWYKGLVPTIVPPVIFNFFVARTIDDLWYSEVHKHLVPISAQFAIATYHVLAMVVTLPLVIITNRAMTTLHKLPWFKPTQSLALLTTARERRRPWALFTPGLLATQVCSILYIDFVMRPLAERLVNDPVLGGLQPGEIYDHKLRVAVVMGLLLALALLGAAVVCPLDVVFARLSVQMIQAPAAPPAAVEDKDEASKEAVVEDVVAKVAVEKGVVAEGAVIEGAVAEEAVAKEAVIRLGSEEQPYKGPGDCVKRMVREEGYRTLFRAWWVTLFAVWIRSM